MRRSGALSILLCLATPLGAEGLTCADPVLSVTGGDAATRARVCTAATRAHETLRSYGAGIDRPIEIAIVAGFATANCLGLYHCGVDRIEILPPAAFAATRDGEGAFALISDADYWESILVHELTHAAYDVVPCPFTSCVATAEYAAYAMQVRSLPEEQRALFGATVPLRTGPTRDAISEPLLAISPDHFAKFAWLHFEQVEAPCALMRRIMEGRVYFDREPL